MRIDINHNRGDTFNYSFPQTNMDDVINVFFTIKDQKCESDSDAIIQIDESTGLLVVNGQVALDSSQASLIRAGRVATILIDAIVTSQIPTRYPLYFDLQLMKNDGGVKTAFNGRWSNISDVTKTIEQSTAVSAMLWPAGDVVLWPAGTAVLWP